MRAKEFVSEMKVSKSNDLHISALNPSMLLSDMDGYYEYYRFMSVVAGDPDRDVPARHKHFNVSPFALAYTPEEEAMLLRSLKKMGKKHMYFTKGKSKEHDSTNKISPVPQNSGKQK